MSDNQLAPDLAPATAPTRAPVPRTAIGALLKGHLRDYGLLLSLLAIMAFFEVVTNGTILRPLNLTNVVLQNSYIVIMALGMLLVIVSGHIDLSIGSVAGFIGAVAAVLMVSLGLNFFSTTIICLGVGALIGAAQGYWVAYFKIPSFIVTLAGMLVFKGLALALLDGQSLGPFSTTFQRLSSGFIPELLPNQSHHYPTSVLLAVLLAVLLVVLGVRQRNRQRRHGAEVEPIVFFVAKSAIIFAIVTAFGVIIASHRGLPNVLIIMAVLIAACFIGGASAYGGVGKVAGAVIGAFIMGVLNNGMSILGIGIDWQQVLKGMVLLGAVCLDVYNQRR